LQQKQSSPSPNEDPFVTRVMKYNQQCTEDLRARNSLVFKLLQRNKLFDDTQSSDADELSEQINTVGLGTHIHGAQDQKHSSIAQLSSIKDLITKASDTPYTLTLLIIV
jgi:hypothetical protein